MVPVVQDASSLELWPLAQAITDVVNKARTGKATREELTGSTITITSLGALGGLVSTPIINAPEVAIIGVNKRDFMETMRSSGVEVGGGPSALSQADRQAFAAQLDRFLARQAASPGGH